MNYCVDTDDYSNEIQVTIQTENGILTLDLKELFKLKKKVDKTCNNNKQKMIEIIRKENNQLAKQVSDLQQKMNNNEKLLNELIG